MFVTEKVKCDTSEISNFKLKASEQEHLIRPSFCGWAAGAVLGLSLFHEPETPRPGFILVTC